MHSVTKIYFYRPGLIHHLLDAVLGAQALFLSHSIFDQTKLILQQLLGVNDLGINLVFLVRECSGRFLNILLRLAIERVVWS